MSPLDSREVRFAVVDQKGRVREGPFIDRDEAEKIRKRFNRVGAHMRVMPVAARPARRNDYLPEQPDVWT